MATWSTWPCITAPWLIAALAPAGLGNGLILPSLIGAPMAGIRPEQAGAAAGLLSTTQQFASVTGIAVIGGLFFTALGSHPGRAAYAGAAELAAWLAFAVTLVMAALVVPLARASATAGPATAGPAATGPAATGPAATEHDQLNTLAGADSRA